ncbi:MAG: FAD-binding domain-containing protein [Pseudomonadota bacterium]
MSALANSLSPTPTFEPSRAAGLERLNAFAPRMGGHYKSKRNYDMGPEDRAGVSLLSPYIRHRLVTEQEALSTALAHHSLSSADKFIQEVFWRTYWKGWLEMRPSVWQRYRTTVAAQNRDLETNRALRKAVEKAEAGTTGIDCFDSWARELVETGYLHNHTRMWFASIWIFTLRLPWERGADFFLRYLLDADAASNTLSWRWVAGLQTRGKNYAAQAWNIKKFTGGRFDPGNTLADNPPPLTEAADLPKPLPPRSIREPSRNARSLLLLTAEDCTVESIPHLDRLEIAEILLVPTAPERSCGQTSAMAIDFEAAALRDAATRAEAALQSGTPPRAVSNATEIVARARAQGASQLVTAGLPVGWTKEWFDRAQPEFHEAGLSLTEIHRRWDTLCWPAATAGFFKFKERIPKFVPQLI